MVHFMKKQLTLLLPLLLLLWCRCICQHITENLKTTNQISSKSISRDMHFKPKFITTGKDSAIVLIHLVYALPLYSIPFLLNSSIPSVFVLSETSFIKFDIFFIIPKWETTKVSFSSVIHVSVSLMTFFQRNYTYTFQVVSMAIKQ